MMSLLKAHYATPTQAQRNGVVTAGELRDWRQVGDILVAAQAQAACLRDQAKEQAQALLEEAQAKGQQQLADLREQAEAAVWQEAAALLSALKTGQQQLSATLQHGVDELALALFNAIAGSIAEADRIQPVTQNLLRHYGQIQEAVLYVHPDDLPQLAKNHPPWPWTLAADAQLARGDCRLENADGVTHATFAGHLAAVRHALDGT
jgi:flagellar biosynthesis/type III secretory pathway protein FliH